MKAEISRERIATLRSPYSGLTIAEASEVLDALSEAYDHRDELHDALRDLLAGWKYIRETHGDLYGVGWHRAQTNAEAILRKIEGEG